MSTTANFGIPKPRETDNIDVEMYRLQTAWDMLDALLFTFLTSIDGKASASHQHTIEQITGLAAALSGKMAANKTFKLSELSDVLGMANAPQGYVPVKNGDGKVFFQSAAAAIGDHQHNPSDIVGLNALIQQYVAAVVDSSPAALDTLKELAAALGNDPNFATTMTNALAAINTRVQQGEDNLSSVSFALQARAAALEAFNAANARIPIVCCFNGQGTIAIRESKGVSSLVDLGTGRYKINFSTTRPNANYPFSLSALWAQPNQMAYICPEEVTSNSITVRVTNKNIGLSDDSLADVPYVSVMIGSP